MDRGETEITEQLQRREPIREQAVQAVRHGSERESIEAAPSLVLRQQRFAANVKPEAASIDHQFREDGYVADPKIEALTGDRMDHMRRLTDQRHPRPDAAFGEQQRQWISPARPDRFDRAEKIAEAGGKFLCES